MRTTPYGLVVLLAALALPAGRAMAGGPSLVHDDGTPYVYDTAGAIQYRTDNGPLSATVGEAAARTRVQNMFNVWQNVATSNISYARGVGAGFIIDVGAFTDGNVSTLAEYNAVEGDCQNGVQSPIVYDVDAAIFIGLNMDEESVIGFAGPCSLDLNAGEFLTGQAVMNGLFQDGTDTPVEDLSVAGFDAVFIHEFGHFSGLDHSQVNVECISGACATDSLAGLPTMFPFLVGDAQLTLSIDDVAWISRLYPAANFNTTHGTITGTIFFSDGESHAQFVNVVARRVDNPGTVGVDESRTTAASGLSGYKFRLSAGNPVNEPEGDPFGTLVPAHIGLYEISLPPGNYMIEVESVADYGEDTGVGPVRIPMPGTAPPPIGPINVTAGNTSSGNDFTLIGSDLRFDVFEGP